MASYPTDSSDKSVPCVCSQLELFLLLTNHIDFLVPKWPLVIYVDKI